jgi:hypothetical protein
MPQLVPGRPGQPLRHRHPRANTVMTPSTPSRHARRQGKGVHAMGCNFASATPDTEVTEAALRNCALTVQVLDEAEPQPPGARPHRTDPAVAGPHRPRHPGRRQTAVSVEGFRCRWWHLSRGSLRPAERSGCAARSASSAVGPDPVRPGHPVPWSTFNADYDTIRDAIADVVPGCADYNRKVRAPDGFHSPTRRGTPASSPPSPQGELRHLPTGVGAGTRQPGRWC